LELHRLFDGVHEDKAYDLCMQFFSYKMNQTDDIATHVGKLKNIWKDLKAELDKDENKDLLLMCRIVETLPSEYFSFASSWRLLNKAERTVEGLTDQLCSYERALASKTEAVQQEALFVKSSVSKSAQKTKKQTKGSKLTKPGNIICHYCTQAGPDLGGANAPGPPDSKGPPAACSSVLLHEIINNRTVLDWIMTACTSNLE
jgi:hypothetical protein